MKISAFIPVTNSIKRGDTFLEAIRSHLYWADELVIVDGGSTDGTLDAIEAIRSPKIKIITRPWPQEGWSWSEFAKAWNAGLKACTGDWVAAGETDHIFNENDTERLLSEIERETNKNKGIIRIEKMQSADYLHWQSKSQMYYFIYKARFPNICYGFDPINKTDLAHPIWWNGKSMYEDIPTGTALLETTPMGGLLGGTGVRLYNYLWIFKTLDQVITERTKANGAWNKFSGFTEIYGKKKSIDTEEVRKEVIAQILRVREKSTNIIPLEKQPKIMRESILSRLKENMIGHPNWKP